jgi:hypothetical protein
MGGFMICGVADSISIPYSERLNSGPARHIMHVLYDNGVWANYGVRRYWHCRKAALAVR